MLITAVLTAWLSSSTPTTTVNPQVLELVEEANTIGVEAGERVWPGFAAVEFPVLLLDGEKEWLICGSEMQGFKASAPTDFGCSLQVRNAQLPSGMLATFPLNNGVPTVVVGTPQLTGRSTRAWFLVLLHEHMHQMQQGMPDYYQKVMALDLHGGDQTGMWMLNYPFPYAEDAVAAAFKVASHAAAAALEADDAGFADAVNTYLTAREAFLSTVSDADRRYFEFQLWQEGVARWTEWAIARELAGQNVDWRQHATIIESKLLEELENANLAEWGRIAVYAMGAAEAELLERLGPTWRQTYFNEPLAMAPAWRHALKTHNRR